MLFIVGPGLIGTRSWFWLDKDWTRAGAFPEQTRSRPGAIPEGTRRNPGAVVEENYIKYREMTVLGWVICV